MNSSLAKSFEALTDLLYLIRSSIDKDLNATRVYLDLADQVMKTANLELQADLLATPVGNISMTEERGTI